MLNYINYLNALIKSDSVFWFCALTGTGMFFFQFILNIFFSIDQDNFDVGETTDATNDYEDIRKFKWFSMQAITGFLMIFGWTAITCQKQLGLKHFSTIGISIASGILTAFIIRSIFRYSKKLQSFGSCYRIEDAIGKEAYIYQSIPKDGIGKISISLQNFTHEIDAISYNSEALSSFTRVKIIEKKTIIRLSLQNYKQVFMFDVSYLNITVGIFLLFLFSTIFFLAKLYRRCPSNKILVVYGRVAGSKTVQCYHGGGTFIWPLIQGYAFLDLTPRTIHIPLKGALSHQNIRVNVPSTFTVAVGITPDVMNNAAVRMLDLGHKEIESMATEIIIGQLRLTVASLRIEEINQDRERFLESIKKNIEPELHKIGLTLLNVNITDITDESNYIESIGMKASSMAVNQAKVDVAEQEKQGDIGKSLAERDRRVSVASYNAEAVKGENDSKAQMALTNAMLAEKEAEAAQRSQVAKQNAEAMIQKARALAQAQLLEAELIVPQEINKRKMQIDAEAEAQSKVIIARGEAEAILSIKQAEAEGIQKLLDAKATGYKQLFEACGEDAKSAATMLLIEKLEEIVKLQVEAIKNIKIDKITVWDSGNSDGKGSSTSNFISQFTKSLPALHDIASLAGLELPEYLGKISPDTLSEINGKVINKPDSR